MLSWATDYREPGSFCQPINEYICYPLGELEVLIPDGMDRVAECESHSVDDVVSHTGDWGRWQINYNIHIRRLDTLGITSPMALAEPLNNWRAMMDIWLEQGFGPWSCKP